MIEAWAKVHEICESVQAKVATILWALQLAKSENLRSIEVKGDAKNCLMFLKAVALIYLTYPNSDS